MLKFLKTISRSSAFIASTIAVLLVIAIIVLVKSGVSPDSKQSASTTPTTPGNIEESQSAKPRPSSPSSIVVADNTDSVARPDGSPSGAKPNKNPNINPNESTNPATRPTAPKPEGDPTRPTNPKPGYDPGTPTRPTQPTKPTVPTKPDKPTDPSKPTNPTTPEKPATPTDPTKPVGPTVPTRPSKPVDPTSLIVPTAPEKPTSPTRPITPDEPTSPAQPTQPTDPSRPTDPTTPTEPSQPAEPTKIDTSGIVVGQRSFTYDGKPHYPTISNLPDGVTPKFELNNAKTDAGGYTWVVAFETAEGYTADPLEIGYTIEPAKITCTYDYDETTGQLKALYSGIVDSDKTSVGDVKYSVDRGAETTVLPTLLGYGTYNVSSTIAISGDKLKNYVLPTAAESSQNFEVKRKQTWYDLELESVDDTENGRILLNVFLKGAEKVACASGLNDTYVQFNVYFDDEQLEFDYDSINNNYVLDEIETWSAMVQPQFNRYPGFGEDNGGVVSRDVLIERGSDEIASSILDNGFAATNERFDLERYQLCQLTFIPKPDKENIVIRIGDSIYTNGSYAPNFEFMYLSNDVSTTVRPSSDAKETQILRRENDLVDDAKYEFPDGAGEEERAIAEAALREHIENNFLPNPKPETPDPADSPEPTNLAEPTDPTGFAPESETLPANPPATDPAEPSPEADLAEASPEAPAVALETN